MVAGQAGASQWPFHHIQVLCSVSVAGDLGRRD